MGWCIFHSFSLPKDSLCEGTETKLDRHFSEALVRKCSMFVQEVEEEVEEAPAGWLEWNLAYSIIYYIRFDFRRTLLKPKFYCVYFSF